jgi:drug/metabolite transporter (DMT)-like permease
LKQNKIFIGSLFGICAAFVYASMATVVKLAAEVNIETLVFFRNVISFVLLFFLLIRKKVTIKTKKLTLHFVRAIFGMLALYSYFFAVKLLPLANAILLANTTPLFIPFVVLIWLRQKIPKQRVYAICLGFFGVALILQPTLNFPLQASFIGIAAGFFASIALTVVRQLSRTEHTEAILFYFFLFAILISFFPMVIMWKNFDFSMWWYILVVGFLATLF